MARPPGTEKFGHRYWEKRIVCLKLKHRRKISSTGLLLSQKDSFCDSSSPVDDTFRLWLKQTCYLTRNQEFYAAWNLFRLFARRGKVDGYGFERPEDFDEKAYEEFMSTYFMVLARRASRWMPVVVGKEHVPKSAKLKRFCRKGIPGEHRPLVWMEVSGAADRMKEAPGLYKQLLGQKPAADVIESIRLDIHRTFPENIYFVDIRDPAGLQKPLKNVLTAFALHNPHIGYCQGLNFITGMLLLILRSEEKTFWLLDTLARSLLPDYYSADMVAVKAEQELLGDIIKWKMPDLYRHLDELGLHWSLVGMKWFICLYADVLPVETVLRIWDAMFYEGSKVLLRVAVTLVKYNKDKLMKTTNFADAVDIFKVMVGEPAVLNCHTFMESIFKETGSMPRARISRMREECTKRVL